MFGMQGLCAQDDPDRTAALQLTTDHSGRSLHIDGDAAALHVVVQQTTIADVLSARLIAFVLGTVSLAKFFKRCAVISAANAAQ
jgi:hypothetical protein